MRLIVLTVLYIKAFLKKLANDSVNAYAAQSAFFTMLSFFPFVMLLATLLRYLPFDEVTIMQFTGEFLSPSVSDYINTIVGEITQKASGTVLSVTTITALWSSSKGVLAIIRGLNSVYGVTEKRGYVALRITALLYTIVFVVIMVITLALLVFGGTISTLIADSLPALGELTSFVEGIRWLVGLCILVLFFMFMYTVVPERKTRFVSEFPGAVISACGWMGFSALYSYYVENIANYSYFYGSLTAVVLLMLWLYICMYIMFVGAEINDVIKDERFMNGFKSWLRLKIKKHRVKKAKGRAGGNTDVK